MLMMLDINTLPEPYTNWELACEYLFALLKMLHVLSFP